MATPESMRNRFDDFVRAVVNTRLLATLGFRVLADIPKSLPAEIRDHFRSTLAAHLDDVKTNGLPWEKQPDGSFVARPQLNDDKDRIVHDIFFLTQSKDQDQTVSELRKQFSLEQSVVMYFAHLDALIQDLFQEACRIDPRVLRSEKQLTVESVLKAGTWEAVVDSIIAEETLRLGFCDLTGKLSRLHKVLGVEIESPEGLLPNLRVAEQARHALVHTAGFVSPTIASRSEHADLKVGARISVSMEYCQALSDGVISLGRAIHLSIAKKFWPDILSANSRN